MSRLGLAHTLPYSLLVYMVSLNNFLGPENHKKYPEKQLL